MEYRTLYDMGAEELKEAGVEEAALDARLLLEEVCGTDRNDLLVHGDHLVAEDQLERYMECIEIQGNAGCADSQAGYGNAGGGSDA